MRAKLSYARVIPCYLTVSCGDVRALNLFADPRIPRVRLRRSTRLISNQANPDMQSVAPTWNDNVGSLGHNAALNRPRLSKTPRRLSQSRKDNGISAPPNIEPFMLAATLDDKETEETLESSDETNGQEIGVAVWCTPANFTQEPNLRRLYGEIRLPRELQPTCKFPLFNILVSRLPLSVAATHRY